MIEPLANNFWLAVGGAFLLWLVLLLAEIRRHGRGGRTLLRVLLLFIAIGSLLLAYLKPGYKARGAATTILLNGEAEETMDSLLQVYPAATVLRLPSGIKAPELYPIMEGISYLPRYANKGSQVFLLGEAVTAQELVYLQEYALRYLPGKTAAGLLSLGYSKQVRLGDTLVVQGQWKPRATQNKLLLSQGSIGHDSAQTTDASIQDYHLKSPLYFEGEQLYHLYVLNQRGDTLENYRLPLEVQEPLVYQLALLTAYPEAESKYLKEYLSQQAYRLQYVAQVAPGKAIQEWINLPRNPLHFNRPALAAWDVLIMSSSYYNTLGKRNQEALQLAQQQEGVGVLLYPDAEGAGINWHGKQVSFAQQAVKDTFLVSGTALPLEYLPLVKVPQGWKVLLQGPKGIAAISRREGLGQVVVSGGVTSYSLLLKGNQQAYHNVWNTLLQEVLPLSEKKVQWELPLVGAEHMPMHLSLYSQDSLPGLQLFGPDQQPIQLYHWQHQLLSGKWEALFWPRQKGWYTALAVGDTSRFWVSQEISSVHQAEMRDLMKEKKSVQEQTKLSTDQYKTETVPGWWHYALFLTSMGALWLEKKMKG